MRKPEPPEPPRCPYCGETAPDLLSIKGDELYCVVCGRTSRVKPDA